MALLEALTSEDGVVFDEDLFAVEGRKDDAVTRVLGIRDQRQGAKDVRGNKVLVLVALIEQEPAGRVSMFSEQVSRGYEYSICSVVGCESFEYTPEGQL